MEAGGPDSLLFALENHAGPDHRWARIAMHLLAGDMAGAAALEPQVEGQNGHEQLKQVIAMGTAHSGDWSLLNSVELDSLVAYTLSGRQGSALYQSILEGYNLAEVELEARFPDNFRSAHGGEEPSAGVDTDYTITAYPTPSDRNAWITYPAEFSGIPYMIQDAQGRKVQQGRFMGNGLMELDCSVLANGIYAIVSSVGGAKGRLMVKR